MVTRVKSKSQAAGKRPSGEDPKSRTLSRGRSGSRKDPVKRSLSNGSQGPDRAQSKLRALSQSRGRSGSPRRPPGRSKSSSDDLLRAGRKPPARSKSFGFDGEVKELPKRSKSFSTDQDRARRARSTSPTRGRSRSATRGRSSSGSGIPRRGKSSDPAQRARSKSCDPARKARSRSRSADRFSDEVIRKEYPSQRPQDNGISRRRLQHKSFRMKRIGGGHKELSWFQLCSYVIPICIILGASVGLIFATGKGSIITDAVNNIIDKFDNALIEDPFIGGSAPHWPENGNGLRITIINALSDPWQVTFTLATADWSLGDPDAIEITEEVGKHDPECEAPDGKIVVCNGDHGDSKWRGVNKAMTLGENLISSSAWMNEFYLLNMEKGAWQYTMCHEIGHALGLAHTDENFNNKDLGNCMDYTNNLDENKHPDQSNYETLLEIYGPISGGRRARERQLQTDNANSQLEQTERGFHLRASTEPLTTSASSVEEFPRVSTQRLRKRVPLHKDSSLDIGDTSEGDRNVTTTSTIPDYIRQREKEAVKILFQRVKESYDNDDYHNTPVGHTHEDGWKLVHRKLHGEEHETDLGEGYKVRVQFLLIPK